MKFKTFRFFSLVLLVLLFSAPPCLAKTTGYFYVVAYSYQEKRAYCSSVITDKVRAKSYSDEEYVTDMKVLLKIETAFQKHIAGTTSKALSRYTVTARGAYKSFEIAKQKLDAESARYTKSGMKVENVTQFKLK